MRQKHEVDAVLGERALLTDQMMKRNTELHEVYERIKLQRSNLYIGEASYSRVMQQLGQWQEQVQT